MKGGCKNKSCLINHSILVAPDLFFTSTRREVVKHPCWFNTAPTPPTNVATVLITPNTILVTWIRSSAYSGRIVYHTVYATPFISKSSFIPRAKRQADSLPAVAKVRISYLRYIEISVNASLCQNNVIFS